MPHIKTTTNISIPKEIEVKIKEEYGKAISIIGKDEYWLMLEFSDNAKMYFQGKDNEPMAYVEVKVYGSVTNSNEMTNVISNILNQYLQIPKNNIYINYKEYDQWGFNGNNF